MFFRIWKSILKGKTFNRSVMNIALSEYSLEEGIVLDIGGGKNPSYFNFIKGSDETNVINFDKQYSEKGIDFEKDSLPYNDNSVDQVLMFNILEHVYNHKFIVSESFRVLKKDKTLIGFVPFLINYHADPNDYFRYTHEALDRIFKDAGFSEVFVKPLGYGPFSINFNNFAGFMPTVFNAFVWPFYFGLDKVLLFFKPQFKERFPVGYLFILKK